MPSTLSYPGVYVEEVPSGVRTLVGVSTSNTAFVDFFPRGPMNEPVRITSFDEFERVFGGLDTRSEASYAIRQYYLNGGSIAFVVRVAAGTPLRSQIALVSRVAGEPKVVMFVEAVDEGKWGDNLQVAVDHLTAPDPATGVPLTNEFNLAVREVQTISGRRRVVRSEILRNLSLDKGKARYAVDAVSSESQLVRLIEHENPGVRPDATTTAEAKDITNPVIVGDPTTGEKSLGSGYENPRYVFRSHADTANAGGTVNAGDDGDPPDAGALIAGVNTLDQITPEIFNLMCVPRAAELDGGGSESPNLRAAIEPITKYCGDRRAFLIVDIPRTIDTPAKMTDWLTANENIRDRNAAVYFPRLLVPDPLNENRSRNLGASGTLAGLFAATDARRGVWKAPAGTDATLRGAQPGHQDHRSGEWRPEPARHQRDPQLPDLRRRRSGARARWTAPTSRPASGSTCRCAARRCSSRRACTRA